MTATGRNARIAVCDGVDDGTGHDFLFFRDVDTAELAALHEIVARCGSWPARMAVERVKAAADLSLSEPFPVETEDWRQYERLMLEHGVEVGRMTR